MSQVISNEPPALKIPYLQLVKSSWLYYTQHRSAMLFMGLVYGLISLPSHFSTTIFLQVDWLSIRGALIWLAVGIASDLWLSVFFSYLLQEEGVQLSLKAAYEKSKSLWGRLICVQVIMLGVHALINVGVFGVLFSIYLGISWIYASYVIIFENTAVSYALVFSRKLVRKYFWRLVLVVVPLILFMGWSYLLPYTEEPIKLIVGQVWTIFSVPLSSIFLARLYLHVQPSISVPRPDEIKAELNVRSVIVVVIIVFHLLAITLFPKLRSRGVPKQPAENAASLLNAEFY